MVGLMAAAAPERAAPQQMPEGMSVEPAGPGEQMASPEEQAVYERFVARGINLIYDERMLERVIDMLSTGDPKQALGATAASIATRVFDMAQQAGQELSGDVVLHGGVEIFEDLANLASVAGIYDFNGDQDALEGAFFIAMDEFRAANGDKMDPEAFKADLAELDAKDKAGTLRDEIMALPGAGGDEEDLEPEMEAGEPEEMASEEIPEEDDMGSTEAEMDEDEDEDEPPMRRRARG